jgi:hypothetical protein
VVYETIKELAIDRKLKEFGLKTDQIAASVGVIAGRMIVPGSERATHYWLQNISALGELMGFDFSLLSLDRLYKASDYLMQHKVAIEDHLCETETRLFGLEEKILLYDQTIPPFLSGHFPMSRNGHLLALNQIIKLIRECFCSSAEAH